MEDTPKQTPETTPTKTSATTIPNPPLKRVVSFKNGKFSYDNGSGDVNVYRRAGNLEVFTIFFEKQPGETWSFTDWTFVARPGAPVKTPAGLDVLKKIDVTNARIEVRDRVTDTGPYRYKYTIAIVDENNFPYSDDPEIENRREITRSP